MGKVDIVRKILSDLDCNARFIERRGVTLMFIVSFWSSRCAHALDDYVWCTSSNSEGRLWLSVIIVD